MENEASIDQESAEETKGSDTKENKRSLSTDATKVKSLPASVRKLQEDSGAKMSFALLFVLKCENQKCKFYEKFYSPSKIEESQAFEVNRRIVLATRNIGIGHQALAKFTCVMNMPPPMNENSYRDHLILAERVQTIQRREGK